MLPAINFHMHGNTACVSARESRHPVAEGGKTHRKLVQKYKLSGNTIPFNLDIPLWSNWWESWCWRRCRWCRVYCTVYIFIKMCEPYNYICVAYACAVCCVSARIVQGYVCTLRIFLSSSLAFIASTHTHTHTYGHGFDSQLLYIADESQNVSVCLWHRFRLIEETNYHASLMFYCL